MSHQLKITRIDVHQYQWQTPNLGADDDYNGFNLVYKPGPGQPHTSHILQIHTNEGITGEFAGGSGADYAQMEMFDLDHRVVFARLLRFRSGAGRRAAPPPIR